MEKTYVFTYVPSAKTEESEQSDEPSNVEVAAVEAKWRVIDYILKQILIKTG
ncbi:hypothetical protein [Paenibacillus sp. OV219]|uniref:hypothetical protein n=1 Tax=Paenibacillus sp. OV219 TaxID=1884377 RepID=UPI0008B1D32C|nr:hypothetical protein [Paenibacillus sp. OV219]SEN05400.1 hypothetical protein SAMN05518847_10247 [Paenibacillus sp. OV219]